MLNSIFRGLFDTASTSVISPSAFLLCVGAALIIGLAFSAMAMRNSGSSRGFALTLSILPAAVCVVIMMVNGNIGVGVAVAGAFGLVRFRSAPGNAREITAVFIAMGIGLIAGMGYLAYAALFALVIGLILLLFSALQGKTGGVEEELELRITIPEDLNGRGILEPVLEQYAARFRLLNIRTSNMGSLYKLTYALTLKAGSSETAMINDLRCRNGNLEISLSLRESRSTEL